MTLTSVFVPFGGQAPVGGWEVFADGFIGNSVTPPPADAEHRPMGLAEGPYGSLDISDDDGGADLEGRVPREGPLGLSRRAITAIATEAQGHGGTPSCNGPSSSGFLRALCASVAIAVDPRGIQRQRAF